MSRGGRGRGRGGSSTIPLEALGIGRGEARPAAVCQPPPTYPQLVTGPLAIDPREDDEYLLEMSRSVKEMLRNSNNYLTEKKGDKLIERYSDKYEEALEAQARTSGDQIPRDLRLFPRELHPNVKNSRKIVVVHRVTVSHVHERNDDGEEGDEGEERRTRSQEKNDSRPDAVQVKKEPESDDEQTQEQEVAEEDEEFNEEDTDYGKAYFDNGENYLEAGSDDDLDEGPTF